MSQTPEEKKDNDLPVIEPGFSFPKNTILGPAESAYKEGEKHTDEMTDPIEFVKRRIAQAFRASQTGISEFYPFDSMDQRNIEGMQRAYILRFLNSVSVPSESQEELWIEVSNVFTVSGHGDAAHNHLLRRYTITRNP